jgi:hypothetical protein
VVKRVLWRRVSTGAGSFGALRLLWRQRRFKSGTNRRNAAQSARGAGETSGELETRRISSALAANGASLRDRYL